LAFLLLAVVVVLLLVVGLVVAATAAVLLLMLMLVVLGWRMANWKLFVCDTVLLLTTAVDALVGGTAATVPTKVLVGAADLVEVMKGTAGSGDARLIMRGVLVMVAVHRLVLYGVAT